MRVRPVDHKSGNGGLRIPALCSLMCNTTMKISLVLGVLAILVCEHTALAQTSTVVIEVGVDEVFAVECYAFENDTTVQNYYGLWEMQLHQSLQLTAVDSNTSSIVCHFVFTGVSHLNQAFPVYSSLKVTHTSEDEVTHDTRGAGIHIRQLQRLMQLHLPQSQILCGDVCHWTIMGLGFHMFNPANNSDTLEYPWLAG